MVVDAGGPGAALDQLAYGDAYGDAYVAETVTDVRHYASPTLLPELPELPEPGRVASLARRYEDRGRFFDPEPFPDVPDEFRLGVERRSRLRSEPAGFALTARAEAVGGSIPTTARVLSAPPPAPAPASAEKKRATRSGKYRKGTLVSASTIRHPSSPKPASADDTVCSNASHKREGATPN